MKLANVIIGVGALAGVWLTVSLPQYWRLPQAAPSLSRSASSHVSLSRPYGLQSTIAKEAR